MNSIFHMKNAILLLPCLLLLSAAPPMNAAVAGTVVAWGDNRAGQANVPAGLSGVTAIAGGYAHTVALKSDGTVVAWGAGTTATGTDPNFGQSIVPVGLNGVTALAAGDSHTVALRQDGSVVAWGYNGQGQTSIPAGLSGVTAIAAGDAHTVALRQDGSVVAWGDNSEGQTSVPAGLSGVRAIAANGSFGAHTVALRSNGTVVVWGNNYWGQTNVPAGLSGVTAIAAGDSHTVALKSDGTVVAWGRSEFGQTTVPVGLSGVTAIAAGDNSTLALKSDGTVVAWGAGTTSQPTGGSSRVEFGQSIVPVGLSGVLAIAAGGYHTVAIVGALPTSIFGHPVSQSFALGGGVSLSVGASGTGLSYQWQFNGTNIPGATQSFLPLSNLTAANAGAYRVVVSSAAGGSLTSQSANLLLFDLKFVASTVLAGPVGQQVRVDYADVVSVGATNWQVLTNITLTGSPFVVMDYNSPGQTKRFYRAVALP